MTARRTVLALFCVLTLSVLVVVGSAQVSEVKSQTLVGGVAEQSNSKSAELPACRTTQAEVLRLRQTTAEMRRTIVSLQVQIEQLRAPMDQQAVEAGWRALEKDTGCPIDRNTGACRPAEPSNKGSKP